MLIQPGCNGTSPCGITESCACVLQIAVRNNQQGVLYFSVSFKPEILASQASAPSNDFFVSLSPAICIQACACALAAVDLKEITC